MKCQHDKCHCSGSEATAKGGYCSDACRTGQTGADGKCGCGHADCK